jgi:uncharacterized protein (TIRG00374 family)
LAVGVAAVLALILGIDVHGFATAVRHFNLSAIPAIVVLSIAYYVLQGVRWHFLLRAVGVNQPMRDTVLLNYAGQATGLLPAGELTRALLVSEATGAALGTVVATVTVQELIYTLLLVAGAIPGSLVHHAASGAVVAALVATFAVVVILTVPRVFAAVRALVVHTPLLRRLVAEVDRLHRDTVVLLRRADTLGWTVLSVASALVSITLFWLVVDSLDPGALSWTGAAFVYGVSHVAGAISLIPGGLGIYEASTVGLLVASGVSGGVAAAVAIVHRTADKGLNTLIGIGAYVIARRRLGVGGVEAVRRAVHSAPSSSI